MSQSQNYQGGCFCGAVEFSLIGTPAAMAYCHCGSCRQWSAGPVNAFTLWSPDSFKTPRAQRTSRHMTKPPPLKTKLEQVIANGARPVVAMFI